MNGILYPLLLAVHLMGGLAIIGLVLLQHGKGADMGAAFGSGASGSLFGASGSANFLSRTTGVLAAVFFLTSISLSYMATDRIKPAGSVIDTVKSAPASKTVPAKPEVPPAAPPAGTGPTKEVPR